MKKINIVIFLFCYLNIYSQQQSILWKIEKDSVLSYIMGTHHLFGESYLKKDKTILPKIEESNLVLVENMEKMGQVINSRSENLYTGFLNEDQLKTLEKIFPNSIDIKKMHLGEILIKTDGFWVKNSCLKNNEKKDSLSIDRFIINTSLKNNIKTIDLEDLQVSLSYIAKYFAYNKIDNNELQNSITLRLENINQNIKYSGCELEHFYRKKKYVYNFDREVNTPLLMQRNIDWMEKIPNLLEEYKKVFIAVGIAHLDYENGLLNLLKNKGYKVTPIKI